MILDVAAHLLAQGHDVLLDSPCRYRELLDSGQQIAAEVAVSYRFIELWAEDVSSVLPRLDQRRPRISQVASSSRPVEGSEWEFGTPLATLSAWQDQLLRPSENWLRLDAARPVDVNLAAATTYLQQ